MLMNFSSVELVPQIYMSQDDLDEIEKLERKTESGGKDYATIPKSKLLCTVSATV